MLREIELHGHRVAYRQVGEGPALLLLHGITSSSETWRDAIPLLARRHTVIAPDLLGHGGSAKPLGDYSLGAFASGVRDLLVALGHDRATLVGHSLGGGVAMQFAYQFPERIERMVLVDSGGLGREVSPLLRSVALPGAGLVMPLLVSGRVREAVGFLNGALGRVGIRPSTDLAEVAAGFASLADLEARRAFVHTARGIIDERGQRVSANDRLYLAADVPVLLVWGERDRIIPVAHGRAAHALIPHSRLEVFAGSGHFPHRDEPVRFVEVLEEFIASTEPAVLDQETLRRRIRTGAASSRRRAARAAPGAKRRPAGEAQPAR